MKNRLAFIIFIAAIALSAAIQAHLDRAGYTRSDEEETILVRSGETLRRLSMGFNGLLADAYWVRTILYFGREIETQRSTPGVSSLRPMPLLEPLLKMTTEIDPHYIAPFRFGAFFLPYQNLEGAIDFTRRGIENNPTQWRLYQDLGVIYWRAGRFAEASEAYAAGGALPGAPGWMSGMAATLAAKGGDIETARKIFTQLYLESDDENIRRICLEHLAEIERKP